ncbi:MAG: 6-carboxyhexanoate--CoA ligase [Nitrospirota bacterium]
MAELFSVRMRAARGGRHISGAERIAPVDEIQAVTSALIKRAMTHENGPPEEIVVTVTSLAGKEIFSFKPLRVINNLPAQTHSVGPQPAATQTAAIGTVNSAVNISHDIAVSELVKAGVSEIAARGALEQISSGASPAGENMRGAMLIDARTGERLERDRARGVRARAVDWGQNALPQVLRSEKELNCVTPHFREALALATKVANAPGAVAELCISDDPHYVTGYVASLTRGYCRINSIKEPNSKFGGRAFFVDADKLDMKKYLDYMRETPVLVSGALEIAN